MCATAAPLVQHIGCLILLATLPIAQDDVVTELAAGKLKLQAPVATTLCSKDVAPRSGSSACSSSSGGGSDGLGGARPLLIVKAARHRPGATPQVLNRFI